jgi:phosphoglucomutase
MSTHPLAGKPAPTELLIDVSELERSYYDPQLVSFGTSGHRGSPLNATFTEAHILAITQAICDYRKSHDITGPLFMGRDSHAISNAAQRTALEVLAANSVDTFIQQGNGVTATPALSLAILVYNRGRKDGLADGIGITPSHNPPADGGFKYNPSNGGPADTEVTNWIQKRANEIIHPASHGLERTSYERAIRLSTTHQHDYIQPYVEELGSVLDLAVIKAAGLKIGVDPLGGASLPYWEPIAERYGLNLTVVNRKLDPTFRFMTLDHDGKIRMDCSSPYAMASLVKLKDKFDVAFGTDPDADRHGIVTPSAGLMNPNHFLAVAIHYLLTNRPDWPKTAAVGKTVVSSSMIDLVVAALSRELYEVPVGFKWFTPGLFDGSVCFAGEESAGACFLRRDGSTWVTEKDGLLLGLLAAEITARTGRDPGQHYADLVQKYGKAFYRRIDAPASSKQRREFNKLTPATMKLRELAGEQIQAVMTSAPGNNANIGGLKVVTQNGWFAARPSGTEDIIKIYAESFKNENHLLQIIDEAQHAILHLPEDAPAIEVVAGEENA